MTKSKNSYKNNDMVMYRFENELRIGKLVKICEPFSYILCFTDKWYISVVSPENILEVLE